MKVIHIIPGSGGTFYCQNCLRDSALVQALRRQGVDAVMAPMYLPMFTDGAPAPSDAPVFFGGINVWLQQQVPLFRKTPRWLDRLLDTKWMLRRAAGMEGTTAARELGGMTLSMLEGEHGHQRKEVERLVDWLAEEERPDVVHLSNALLIGLAEPIRERLQVPVICSLQDEDWWLDAMDAPDRAACWEAIRSRAPQVDRFVAVSQWFADRMSERMDLSSERIEVVHVGIDLQGCDPAPLDFDPPVIGYLSRMNEELGLGRLVDAFIALKQRPGLERLKLRATGGAVGADRKYIDRQRRKLDAAGVAADAEFLEAFDRPQRLAFLQSLSVLSVPVEQGEAFGSYILEALAVGVPVVQPAAGAFPELVDATGGGLIYEDLTETMEELLRNPELARRLGTAGRQAVHERFGIERMAQQMNRIYEEVTDHV